MMCEQETTMKTVERFWTVMHIYQKGDHYLSHQEAIDKAKQQAEESETGQTFYVLEVVNAFSRGEAPINEFGLEDPVREASAEVDG
jgi:hypothetical protein